MTFEPTTNAPSRRPAASASRARASSPLQAPALAGRPSDAELIRSAVLQRLAPPDISMPVGEFRLASLYWPCEASSGAFYDLTWREDCAVLLVADVMGTGVEAAVTTMLARAAFVESAGETADPCALLAGMRARLHRLRPRRVYVAAVVVRLPFDGPAVDLANAGLPHPFVLRAAERRVEEIDLGGVPLGLFLDEDPAPPTAQVVSLAPADLLFVSSADINRIAVCRRGVQGAAHA